ncbi:protein dispatched homolog 2 [Protopterus annectens]|uniref:protein dispatched homolog 2 n=1 Tax=Protopterus annectens TaxID=7888 RepID=UPI001CFA2CBC|nr:protein dispatched homolog 2 [Protopterus annectens]
MASRAPDSVEQETSLSVVPKKEICCNRNYLPISHKEAQSHNQSSKEQELGNPSHSGHGTLPQLSVSATDQLPVSGGKYSGGLNGQIESGSGNVLHQKKCLNCSHQQSRTGCTKMQNTDHVEKLTLCSHHSSIQTVHSGKLSPSPSHLGTPKCQWKQRSHDQKEHHALQQHIVTVRHDKGYKMPKSYAQLIANWPGTVLVTCSVLVLVCTLAGILTGDLPDFSRPLLGFEPRGTELANRLAAWNSIQQHTGNGKTLLLYPYTEQVSFSYADMSHSQAYGLASTKQEQRKRRMVEQESAKNGFFCGTPDSSYSQLVFMTETRRSLWNLTAIQSMCRMESEKIRSHPLFANLCKRHDTTECCPSWSLGNYIAVMNKRPSCLEITNADVSHTLKQLRSCAPYYHNSSLRSSCMGLKREKERHPYCSKLLTNCTQLDAVYYLLHYLVDKDFLSPQTENYQVPSLKYSMLFLPVEKGKSMMRIYMDNLERWNRSDEITSITGIDFGIKQNLYHHYLAMDTVYPVLAMLAIFIGMGFYLHSAFITFMVIVAVISSLIISYFLYKVAFRFSYFPFINLIAIILLTSICANNAFVFMDLWNLHPMQKSPGDLSQRVSQTLHHFGYLMTVSSFTISAAFYALYLSNITAIRCFSVYMGTSVLVSFAFLMTWFPVSVVLHERFIGTSCSYSPPSYWDNSRKRYLLILQQKFKGFQRTLSDTLKLLFEKLLPCAVIKFRYIWIFWFAALAVGGTYIVCVDPKMKLPTLEMPTIQVFRSSHPFERYDAEYSHQFMFERVKHGEDRPMPVTLVWGIKPIDNGDHLNPMSNSTLVIDTTLNISSLAAQTWLYNFCDRVNQTFPLATIQETTVCFMKAFQKWMESRQCSENTSFNPCCNNFLFPYASEVFEYCIKIMAMEKSGEQTGVQDLGPRFDAEGKLVALVLQFQSSDYYSFNFSKTKHFYEQVNSWLMAEAKTAPPGLQNVWFVSNLELYNLQEALSTQVLVVTGLSIAISWLVLLLTTWNILLAVYSVATIAGTVFVTVGLLVLLEWQLNAVESLFISTAVGLSVDFTVNYCISYHLCPHSDRFSRVAFSLKQVSCATAMGASALFSLGVIMLPATVLAYRQLGIFLMMIKCINCGFATFFFQSLCCFFGPEKNCGQIMWPCPNHREYSDHGRTNRTFTCGETENHTRSQQVKETVADSEQYELQALARNLSDSFDNSTCTSKLSTRPSVLSDEVHLQDIGCSGIEGNQVKGSIRNKDEKTSIQHINSCQCPAMQTSSPYKQNSMKAAMDTNQDRICRHCHCQNYSPNAWDRSMTDHTHLCSTEEGSMPLQVSHCTTDCTQQKTCISPCVEKTTNAGASEFHRGLYSSSSSFDVLNDSSETCLSECDPSVQLAESRCSTPEAQQDTNQTERGQLNGRRETLRLALKDTVFDTTPSSSHHNSSSWRDPRNKDPVIVPNSKPDMPDVWVKRSNEYNPGHSS